MKIVEELCYNLSFMVSILLTHKCTDVPVNAQMYQNYWALYSDPRALGRFLDGNSRSVNRRKSSRWHSEILRGSIALEL